MNKSFFTRVVLLIMIAVICLVAMIVMAIQRESGQEVVPESTMRPVVTLLVSTKTYAFTAAFRSNETQDSGESSKIMKNASIAEKS